MEENTKNEPNKISEPAHDASKDKKKDDNKKTLNDRFNEYKGEFRKIVWPSRKDLYKQTVTVIVISLIVGVLIFGMDTVYGFGYSWLVQTFG